MSLTIGLVGARRGLSLIQGVRSVADCQVTAVCDLLPERCAQVAQEYEIPHQFSDYVSMLDSGTVNAVVIATPQFLHAPQAVEALRRDLHVLSEVPAATDLMQCCELLDAVRDSRGIYMISENCCYMTPNVLVREMAHRGLLGELYFAEGEYIHALRELYVTTPWRRRWQSGRNGVTYPTHQLGPVLQWIQDRITSVSCLGSGHHYLDTEGKPYEQEDCILMTCRTARGGMVKVRQDILSERPHITCAYSLQGTEGCYESARSPQETGKVWLKGRSPDNSTWLPLTDFTEEFLPSEMQTPPEEVASAGHGGTDFWVARDFAAAALEQRPPTLDVHFALDITVPGLISEQSIALEGAPIRVPDFRRYVPGSKVLPAV
jgi:predicted dehydrogenase